MIGETSRSTATLLQCLALCIVCSQMYAESDREIKAIRFFFEGDFSPFAEAEYSISGQAVDFDESFLLRDQEAPSAIWLNLETGVLIYERIQLSVCYSGIEQGGSSLYSLSNNSISLNLINGKLTMFPFRKLIFLFIGGGSAKLSVSHQEMFMADGDYLDEKATGSGILYGGGLAIPIKDVASLNIAIETAKQTYKSDSVLESSEYTVFRIGVARYY